MGGAENLTVRYLRKIRPAAKFFSYIKRHYVSALFDSGRSDTIKMIIFFRRSYHLLHVMRFENSDSNPQIPLLHHNSMPSL